MARRFERAPDRRYQISSRREIGFCGFAFCLACCTRGWSTAFFTLSTKVKEAAAICSPTSVSWCFVCRSCTDSSRYQFL